MSLSKRSTLARGVILMNIHVDCKVSLFYSCNLYAIEWFFLFCLKQEKLSASEKIAKLEKECQQLKQTIKTKEADIVQLQSQIDSKVRLLAVTLQAFEHEFLSRSFYQPIPNLLGLPATSCARNCPKPILSLFKQTMVNHIPDSVVRLWIIDMTHGGRGEITSNSYILHNGWK